jgi:hypothetical protein
MSEQLFGILLTALGLCVVALIGLIGNIIIKRMKPALTQPEMWERVDKLTAVIYGGTIDGKHDIGLLERVTQAEKRADAAEQRANTYEKQTVEMIHHILVLEDMVPNPPGPPTRPKWKLPILHRTEPINTTA